MAIIINARLTSSGIVSLDFSGGRLTSNGIVKGLLGEGPEPTTPSITDIDGDNTVYDGQTAVITGTNFLADQGSVTLGGVVQTITNWTDTAITIVVVRGALNLGANDLIVTDSLSAESPALSVTLIEVPEPLVINLITNVTKGVLSLGQNGSFTYNYTAGLTSDTDFFVYSITDGGGTSNEATVYLTISDVTSNVYLGDALVTELFVGNTPVTEMYLGDTKVF